MAKIVIDYIGTKTYFNSGGWPHREDGPAVIFQSTLKIWKRHGVNNNPDGPSTIMENGIMCWTDRFGYYITKGRPNFDHPNGWKTWNTGKSKWPEL